MREHLHVAESEEGTQAKRRLAVRLQEGVANERPIDVVAEDELLAQHDPADAVGRRGYDVDVVLTDILVSLGAEDIALILVDPDIEGHAVLHDRQVEAGEQYVIIGAECRDRDDEHTMVFAGIAADDTGATVGTLSIRADVLSLCGLIQVSHQSAVKLEVTHSVLVRIVPSAPPLPSRGRAAAPSSCVIFSR